MKKSYPYSTQHHLFPDVTNTAGSFVGIDCIALPPHFSGAAYYIYHLTRSLLQEKRTFSLAIFCKPQHVFLFKPFLRNTDKIVAIPLRNRVEQLYFYEYRLRSLILREDVSLFYATHYICPPTSPGYQLITTFHDMGFVLHPQYYPVIKRLYFGLRIKTFLQRANHIVAVSQSTATTLQEFYPEVDKDKISVIYPGTDHLLTTKTSPPQRPHTRPPYLISVNTLEKRKNIPFLIRLFNVLKVNYQLPHRLLLVGHPANGFKEINATIRQSPFRSEIHSCPYLPEEHLNYYYQESDFFVNSSKYEGFGFTPFEAIQHDCPAFLYQNNAVEEVLGNHNYIMKNLSVAEWAENIYSEYTQNFQNKIPKDTISHLTWQNCARSTIRLFDTLLK